MKMLGRWIQVSFLRTIKIINKIPLMMYRKILNYKHIFDILQKGGRIWFSTWFDRHILCQRKGICICLGNSRSCTLCSAFPICGGESDLDAGAQKHPVCGKMRTTECRKAGGREFCGNSGAEPDKPARRSCKCGRERKNGSKYDCWRKRRSQRKKSWAIPGGSAGTDGRIEVERRFLSFIFRYCIIKKKWGWRHGPVM